MPAPVGPDYTPQLEKLIHVLSQKESMPAWVIALLSAVIGFILGLVAEPIKTWILRLVQVKQLRKVVLNELMRNIQILHNALELYERHSNLPAFDATSFTNVVKQGLTKTAYETAVKDVYIYYVIPEHVWIDNFYYSLNRLFLDPTDTFYIPDSIELVQQLTASFYAYVKNHQDTRVIVEPIASDNIKKMISLA